MEIAKMSISASRHDCFITSVLWWALFVFMTCEYYQITMAEECITGFSVVVPETAVPGKSTAVFITLSHPPSPLFLPAPPAPPFNVTLRLLNKNVQQQEDFDNDGGGSSGIEVLMETTDEIKSHGVIELKIPPQATGSCTLQIFINCTLQSSLDTSKIQNGDNNNNKNALLKENHCDLTSTAEIRLLAPVRDVIIRPAKHTYQPEETVTFWMLALNHDLQVPGGAIGTVSIKDPQGTKVAIWDQVSLDEGVKSFSIPLSIYALTGRWLVNIEVEQTEFSASFDVVQLDGGVAAAEIKGDGINGEENSGNGNNNGLGGGGGGSGDGDADGSSSGAGISSVAEEHYVELRFASEMRRIYKPGLPFSGKVQAMSTEKSVRVRVKVYDNITAIYSQDIEITNGEGAFTVPSIMADSDVIALQAELVSVESKEIESHYVLAREPIRKWNSTSDCYLLIEGVEHTLEPGDKAAVTVLSTCPCETDTHYVITTAGRVTDWAQQRNEDVMVPSASTQSLCKLTFSFDVKSVMAPTSQLLVYYVTEMGEPISDLINFHVKLFDRDLSVTIENKEWWLPDQSLDLEITAAPSSLVCLLGGKSGDELDARFNPRISEEHVSVPITTGEIDFLEAGVSFFERRCVRRGVSGRSAITYRQSGSGAGPSDNTRHRRYNPPESLVGGSPLDQLWMWNCFNYSSADFSTVLSVTAPNQAGKWSIWALTMSKNGLRFSAPVEMQVFRPLTLYFRLPPNWKVHEIVEVDIKIKNNVNLCVDVTALLAVSEGVHFINNELHYVTERLRLGPHGATALVVKMSATTIGKKNMTIEVNGYTSSTCEDTTNINNSSMSGAVTSSRQFDIYPEGIERLRTESSYFCANENLVISTVDDYKYEWIQAPKNHQHIIVEIKTAKKVGPVHIALAANRSKLDRMYRISIGDSDNSMSHIGRGQHNYGVQLVSVETQNILSEDVWKSFWITWDKNTIAFGNGSTPSSNVLLKWKMDKKIKIGLIGFASSWGALAEFRIWNYNEESGYSQVLHLDTPKNIIPGSEFGELTVTGGLALPEITEISSGDLNGALASLAPLLIAEYPSQLAKNKNKAIDIITKLLPIQMQSILSFKKEDDSFSEHPMFGSHRATISILEALTKVQQYFSVDPDLIQAIKRWVQLRQEDDGRFMPLDADVHLPSFWNNTVKNISTEALHFENIVEITAETVIALYEIGIETDADSDTLQKAKIFLENSLPNVEFPETIAAVTLALVLVRSATAAWAIEKLRNASTTADNEFGWPTESSAASANAVKQDAGGWLYESSGEPTLNAPLDATTVEEYRASLYALSTFCSIGDLKSAQSVAKYLFYRSHMLDNHYELLYPAVKAFVEYNNLAGDQHRSLSVSVATSGMELTETIKLFNKDKQSHTLHLPSIPTKVFVYATGAGCATLQGRIRYSTYSVTSKTSLLEIGSEVIEEVEREKNSIDEIEGKPPTLKIQTCFKWKGLHRSAVLRLEITLFSGYELMTSSPPQLLNSPMEMAEMQHGNYENHVWYTFANISSTISSCPICVQYTAKSSHVIRNIRPAYARIYPATREDLAADVFFHHIHNDIKPKMATAYDQNGDNVRTKDNSRWWVDETGISKTNPDTSALIIPEKCKRKSDTRNWKTTESFSATEQSAFTATELNEQIVSISSTTEKTEPATLILELDEDEKETTTTITTPVTAAEQTENNFVKSENEFEIKTKKKVLIGEIRTDDQGIKSNINNNQLNRHFEIVGSSLDGKKETFAYEKKKSIKNSTEIDGNSNSYYYYDWTHQTSSSTTTPKNSEAQMEVESKTQSLGSKTDQVTTKEVNPVFHSLMNHRINTEFVHDVPKKFMLHTDNLLRRDAELFKNLPSIKIGFDDGRKRKKNNNVNNNNNDQEKYILLNKDSLWGMLKEAAKDDYKRKEMRHILIDENE